MALCTLGCPAQYYAVFHWKCGDQVFMPVDNLTSLTFSRTLNDTAKATITITKDSLDDTCCENLENLEPWLHELSIYRDTELVWQGPVMTVTETRATVTVEAWDISAWIARIVNFSTKAFKRGEADVSSIARYYIDWNLLTSSYACTQTVDGKKVDHACLTPYIVRYDVGAKPAYKPQDQTKNVVDLLNELVKSGLCWTTLGRRLVLKGKPGADDLPVAELTTDDLMGDFSIVRDGQSFATRAVVTNSSSEEDRQTITTGKSCANPYGRVDWLVSSTDVPKCECDEKNCTKPGSGRCRGNNLCGPCSYSKTRKSWSCENEGRAACKKCIADCVDDCKTACEADQRAALLDMAKAELKGRYPVPVGVSVNNGAALHPEAPVCFDQLVPGYRIDLRIDRACRKVQQAFVLADVTVTWDAGGEKVAVSLTPMDAPGTDEDQKAAGVRSMRAAGEGQAAAWFESGELPPPPAEAVELAQRAAR